MDTDHHKQLEALIRRELKQLPELTAPATLLPRVFAALEQRAAVPWYRRAWQTWPLGLRMASFAMLAGSFGCLCAAAWQLSHGDTVSPVTGFFGALGTAATVFATVFQALLLGLLNLNPLWLAAILFVVALGWVSCVGMTTALVRLATPRRISTDSIFVNP